MGKYFLPGLQSVITSYKFIFLLFPIFDKYLKNIFIQSSILAKTRLENQKNADFGTKGQIV